jgi:parallel beta-helix repeat protein
MRRALIAMAVVTALGVVALPGSAMASAASCTPTGWVRDSINMTAAQIGGDVTGSLDAGGCNIGVYYGPLYDSGTTYPVTQGNVTGSAPAGNVTGATIFGANYFGVVVNGDEGSVAVNVTGTAIHDIGNTPLDGTQHGNAIYYRAFGGTASGTISGNTVTNYQKGGIIVGGAVSATIRNNTVTGQTPVSYIAQNGIQVGYGAKATVTGNTVTENAYTGTGGTSSAGILVVGGPCFGLPLTTGLVISKNTLTNNDVGVWLFNANLSCSAVTTKTNNSVKLNTITNGAVTNTTGYSATCGYQAGVSDVGHRDAIVNNKISGLGYTPQNPDCSGTPPAFLRRIDTDSSARAVPSNK